MRENCAGSQPCPCSTRTLCGSCRAPGTAPCSTTDCARCPDPYFRPGQSPAERRAARFFDIHQKLGGIVEPHAGIERHHSRSGFLIVGTEAVRSAVVSMKIGMGLEDEFACPESQKRVLLKCGNIASGSDGIVGGWRILLHSPRELPPFGGDASGCCACAAMTQARRQHAATHAASSVLAARRDRFAISVSPFRSTVLIHQYALRQLRERYSSRLAIAFLFRIYY